MGAISNSDKTNGALFAANPYLSAAKQADDNLNGGHFQGSNLGPKGGAPGLANIQQATDVGDVNRAQQGAQNSLVAQNNLLAALQGQNGLGLQNSIVGQQQGLANQLQAANGVGTQNSAISGLQNAAGMYGDIAQGLGPNPAQAMLNQQTGQNIQNQAALMAGQRGAGANTGLLARQAGQMGGNLQQQAVGQGAVMQANQQLAGLQGFTGAQQALGGLGTTQVGQLQGQQGVQAGMANQIAGQQIGQVNTNAQNALANQQMMQNALAGINNANVANQGNVNAGNVSLAQSNITAKSGLLGGLTNAAGAGVGMVSGAEGGQVVKKYAAGNVVDGSMPEESAAAPEANDPNKPQSSLGKYMSAVGGMGTQKEQKDIGDIAGIVAMFASKGGLAESGGHVKANEPEQKAVKSGNSYDNDKIPAKLSEGEIVLPRSVTMAADPIAAAAAFVKDTIAKRKAIPQGDASPKMMKDAGDLDAAKTEDQVNAEDNAEAAPEVTVAPAVAPVVETVPEQPAAPADSAIPQGEQSQEFPEILAQNQAALAAQPEEGADDDAEGPDDEDLDVSPEGKIASKAKLEQDLGDGKIHPQTMSDMWHNKGTLSKIGSLFGLMLSGAGSGLAHQDNAYLKMMDNQIARDLNAQQHSIENKQSILKTYATINQQKAQTAATNEDNFNKYIQNNTTIAKEVARMRARHIPEETIRRFQINAYKAMQDTWVRPEAESALRTGMVHHLKNVYGGLPQAQSKFAQMDAWNNQHDQRNLAQGTIASNQVVKNMANKELANPANSEKNVFDEDAYQNGLLLDPADENDRLAMPGSILPGDKTAILDQKNKFQVVKNDLDIYHDVANDLNKIPFGGESTAGIFSNVSGNAKAAAAGHALDRFLNPDRVAQLSYLQGKYPELAFPGIGSDSKKVKKDVAKSGENFFKNEARKQAPLFFSTYPNLIKNNTFVDEAPSKSEKKSARPIASSKGSKKSIPQEDDSPALNFVKEAFPGPTQFVKDVGGVIDYFKGDKNKKGK